MWYLQVETQFQTMQRLCISYNFLWQVIQTDIWGIFLNPLYGCPMDHFQRQFINNYLIFKLNYVILFYLITISHLS